MEFVSQTELASFLSVHGVDLGAYGRREAKTLEQLWTEVEKQECTLLLDGAGKIRRRAYGAQIAIYYRRGDKTLQLIEDCQVFHDGRIHRRQLGASIGEKMQGDEKPLAAARRALSEELGIEENLALDPEETQTKTVHSLTYPGLISEYVIYTYSTWLPDHLYKPEGYVEVQEDKTNYWVWHKTKRD